MTVSPTRMFKEMSRFLGKYGISVVNWEPSSRHRKVWVTDGARTAMIVVSVSPSDRRAYLNMAQSARTALREAR